MKQRIILIVNLLLMVFLFDINQADAAGTIVIQEDFTNRTNINETQTNAIVDTAAGKVKLPKMTEGKQSFHATDNTVIVAEGNRIKFYQLTDTGAMVENTSLSYVLSENLVGVHLAPNGWDHYVLTESGTIYHFQFTGSQFVENPAYRLSGFQSVLSFSANDVGVSVVDLRKVLTARDTGTGLSAPTETYQIADDEPKLLTSDGSDLAVTDSQNNVHYLSYNGSNYVRNPYLSLNGVGNGDIKRNRMLTQLDNQIQLQENGMEILSFNHSGTVSAINSENAIYVRDGDSIDRYVYSGTGVTLSNSISGLSAVTTKYHTPRNVQTKSYILPKSMSRFQVDYSALKPAQTDVKVSISSDGNTFYEASSSGSSVTLPSSTNQLYLRAVLSTTDLQVTPELDNITIYDRSLYVDTLTTTNIVQDPGGNPPLPTTLPVRVTGGFNFSCEVLAPGATSVEINFSNGEIVNGVDQGVGLFSFTHYFPEDATGTINAEVVAKNGGGDIESKIFPAHFIITENLLGKMKIVDTK